MGSLDTQTMLSTLEANGVIPLTLGEVGDLYDIDRRIKTGDESGWRGDPTMCVCRNTFTGMWEVWGKDRAGKDYKAASHDRLDHTLLIKLREGDPTRNDVWDRVLKHNAKVRADQEAAEADKRAVVADKMAWAIRQDFATHLGGVRHRSHGYTGGAR